MEKSHVFLDIAGLQIDFCTRFPEYVMDRCVKYLSAERRLFAQNASHSRPRNIVRFRVKYFFAAA